MINTILLQDIFSIQHVDFATLERVSYGEAEEVIVASALRSNILEKFIPFVEDNKAIYKVSSQKRDRAFKEVVLEQYAFTCAVTGMQYYSDHLVEAQAAHIILRRPHGSDDPEMVLRFLARSGHSIKVCSRYLISIKLLFIQDQACQDK